MLVICRGGAVVMCVVSRRSSLHPGGCTAAMVIGAAKRHGRDGSTLRGNCQHQQPYQQRSDQQTHPFTLSQRVRPALTTTFLSPRRSYQGVNGGALVR